MIAWLLRILDKPWRAVDRLPAERDYGHQRNPEGRGGPGHARIGTAGNVRSGASWHPERRHCVLESLHACALRGSGAAAGGLHRPPRPPRSPHGASHRPIPQRQVHRREPSSEDKVWWGKGGGPSSRAKQYVVLCPAACLDYVLLARLEGPVPFPPPDLVLAGWLADDELVVGGSAGVMPRADYEGAEVADEALPPPHHFLVEHRRGGIPKHSADVPDAMTLQTVQSPAVPILRVTGPSSTLGVSLGARSPSRRGAGPRARHGLSRIREQPGNHRRLGSVLLS